MIIKDNTVRRLTHFEFDMAEVWRGFTKWNKSGRPLRYNKGLHIRRDYEAVLFIWGIYDGKARGIFDR